jgi:hypothetical protein
LWKAENRCTDHTINSGDTREPKIRVSFLHMNKDNMLYASRGWGRKLSITFRDMVQFFSDLDTEKVKNCENADQTATCKDPAKILRQDWYMRTSPRRCRWHQVGIESSSLNFKI